MNLTLLENYESAVRRMASATNGVESSPASRRGLALIEYERARAGLTAARHALEASGVLAGKRSESCLQREVRTRERAKPKSDPFVSIHKIREHLRSKGEVGGWKRDKFGARA